MPHLRPLGHLSSPVSSAGFAGAPLPGGGLGGGRPRPPPTLWRRGEDLNPRGTFWAPIRFRVGRLQPGSATPPHQPWLRFVSKNSAMSARHSSPSTPPSTRARWFRRGSSSSRESGAPLPDFGSGAPYTTRSTRAKSAAPQHIAHGSTVT